MMEKEDLEKLRKDYKCWNLYDAMLKKEEYKILHEVLKLRDDDGNFIEFSANEKTLRIVAGNEAIERHNCYVFELDSTQCKILNNQINMVQ